MRPCESISADPFTQTDEGQELIELPFASTASPLRAEVLKFQVLFDTDRREKNTHVCSCPIIQSMALTEAEFRSRSDAAFEKLNRSLGVVTEQYDVEILLQNNVLSIEIEDPNPGKIV